MTRPRHLASALALVAVLGVAGCGDQTPESVSASAGGADLGAAAPSSSASGGGSAPAGTSRVVRLAVGDQEPRLACPRAARSMMIADFAHGAPGSPTPQDAVGWDLLQAGEQMVLSRQGTTAWVVRPDGSVRVEVGLLRHDGGWLLHQRTSCD